ncbi:MAG: hypothetical protein EHM61_23105 [Acidobacteria bacterium]|nr:MAG: hypothetical protein EHM61_23105 [Acidobacteriota bacterium]
MRWSFWCYTSRTGRRVVEEWLDSVPASAQANYTAIKRRLKLLQEWPEPAFRKLRGRNYSGLGEIRFSDDDNVQYRLIGYHSSESRFVILIGCTHKQRRYNPTNALETAVKRKKQVAKGKVSLHEEDS